MTDRVGPLKGVRVLDLTQALAGPYCTMLLADLGADVIKVESSRGEMTRFSGPFTDDDTERAFGGYYASLNRNKRSLVLDLKTPGGKEAVIRLAEKSDVLVENFAAGVMERLGLSYETLAERNPRLVYAAIRGFGDPRTGEFEVFRDRDWIVVIYNWGIFAALRQADAFAVLQIDCRNDQH